MSVDYKLDHVSTDARPAKIVKGIDYIGNCDNEVQREYHIYDDTIEV